MDPTPSWPGLRRDGIGAATGPEDGRRRRAAGHRPIAGSGRARVLARGRTGSTPSAGSLAIEPRPPIGGGRGSLSVGVEGLTEGLRVGRAAK